MKKSEKLKIVVFAAVVAVLYLVLQKAVTDPDSRNFQWVQGFYEEQEESLDAVYIGSSNCYAFWNTLVAWEEYGITVWPYATNSQPFIAAEYLIKEVRKTQPDTLFIINTSTLSGEDVDFKALHYLLDYMPFSLNKLALTNYLCDVADFTLSESVEYYLPMVRYHSRWNELKAYDFNRTTDVYKGASMYMDYKEFSNDITAEYITTEDCAGFDVPQIPQYILDALESLFTYIDSEGVEVLFVSVPRAEDSEEDFLLIKEVNDYIAENGYDVMYMHDNLDEIGIDTATDFYNYTHTNIHGSIKFTHYLSKYIVEKYSLESKRGQPEYADWEASLMEYQDKHMYTTVLEYNLNPDIRDYSIPVPQNLAADVQSSQVQISWDAAEGVDGYVVFRKTGFKGRFERIATTDELSFTDTDIVAGEDKMYGYTVAAYCVRDGVEYFGDHVYDALLVTS